MPPILIAIDGNEANVSNRVGSNTYAFELLNGLERISVKNEQLAVTVLLSSPPLSDLPVVHTGWRYQVLGPKPLWTQFALPWHLFLHHYDVLYSPGHYAPRLSSVPYVSSVMDLAFLEYPDQFKPKDLVQLKNWTRYSVLGARKVIAISQKTKADVIKYYGRKASDVTIAYPAISPVAGSLTATDFQRFLKISQITQPYILYVGTLQPRKNLIRLIEAFEQLQQRQASLKKKNRKQDSSPLQLVLAGKVGWLAEPLLARIEASPFVAQIKLIGYVDELTKKALYQNTHCAVLVGLSEGFGIPPLEALAWGAIPVVSNTTSLPEVVGKAGILVDPLAVDAIAQGMEVALLLSAKERAYYRKEARLQLKKFDWDKSAQTVLDVLLTLSKS